MENQPPTPAGETSSGPPPPPPSPSSSSLVRRLVGGMRSDVLELEAIASQLVQKIASSRAQLVTVETLLSQLPSGMLAELVDFKEAGDDVDLF